MFTRGGLFYASTPPRLFDFACPDPQAAAGIQALLARDTVACPDEWILALRRGVWGVRTLAFMGYYARPEAAREIGYRAAAAGWAARCASSGGQ